HVRGALTYDAALGAFRPAGNLPGVTVIGAAGGTFDLADVVREAAGDDAPVVEAEPKRTPPAVLWRTDGDPGRQFVDIQRDATVADIGRAVGAGLRSV